MKKSSILFGMLCFAVTAFAQEVEVEVHTQSHKVNMTKQKINWYTWEEAVEASKAEKRKIVVDVYTNWCGWCKRMDKTTFNDTDIASYLNENYYPVKLNAEQKGDILYNNHTFKYIASGRRGYHELAVALLNGKLSYPTIVFLNEDFQIIQRYASYLDAQQFDMVMRYLGEELYDEINWADYQKKYQKKVKNK